MDTPEAFLSHWLNADRLRVYPRLLVAVFAGLAIAWFLRFHDLLDADHAPLGSDFITYWSAGQLALSGHTVDSWNLALMGAAERAAIPGNHMQFAWFYPPTAFLIVQPLATLPYPVAYALFEALTLAGFLWMMRRVLPVKGGIWLVLAFPGVLLNILYGQNAFLTATLGGLALHWRRDRPVLAGIALGLLASKPHLALLFPLVLLLDRNWRMLVSAGITVVAAALAATGLTGIDAWPAWWQALSLARELVENGRLPWPQMPTVFAQTRLLGAPLWLAWALHMTIATIAVIALLRLWCRTSDTGLQSAALVCCTLLVSPYLYHYDELWLALPLAWLSLAGHRLGWQPGEREWLLAAWWQPYAGVILAIVAPILLGPFLTAMLMHITWRMSAR